MKNPSAISTTKITKICVVGDPVKEVKKKYLFIRVSTVLVSKNFKRYLSFTFFTGSRSCKRGERKISFYPRFYSLGE